MKRASRGIRGCCLSAAVFFVTVGPASWGADLQAQEVVKLYGGETLDSGSLEWTHQERRYHSDLWQTDVVTNVSDPELIVHLPEPSKATGTGVVVAPGGGFVALSIESEGLGVARWLNERGVAAFVLKYRLLPSGEDGVREMMTGDRSNVAERFAQIRPLSVADGLAAMRLVRERADEWGVRADRIGFMGFSAGGAVAMGVVGHDDPESRPDFLAPIYAGAQNPGQLVAPDEAPPIFVVAASDDQLGLADDSVMIYSAWLKGGHSAELHMYSTGGHGFGTRTLNLPSDTWLERFGDWMGVQGLLKR